LEFVVLIRNDGFVGAVGWHRAAPPLLRVRGELLVKILFGLREKAKVAIWMLAARDGYLVAAIVRLWPLAEMT